MSTKQSCPSRPPNQAMSRVEHAQGQLEWAEGDRMDIDIEEGGDLRDMLKREGGGTAGGR